MPTVETIEIMMVIFMAASLILVIVIQQIQIRRYERFRREMADVLINFTDNISDVNMRLTAAGYPPGRVLPAFYPREPRTSEAPAE